MIWRILDIVPGDAPNDYLVTVGFWYDQINPAQRRPDNTADFIEHHLVSNVPQEPRPLLDDKGRVVRQSWPPFNPWIEEEGEWRRARLDELPPDALWVEPDSQEILNLITGPLQTRAAAVAVSPPAKGKRDLYPQSRLPGRGKPATLKPEIAALRDRAWTV